MRPLHHSPPASWMMAADAPAPQRPHKRRSASPGEKLIRTPSHGESLPESVRWLLSVPQPAHLLTLVGSLCLAFLVWPGSAAPSSGQPSTLSSLMYVAAFATHFGTQFWMTFASGLVLFFSLPRRVFGSVQRCLFPKYFLINAMLSGLSLILFLVHHPSAILTDGEPVSVQVWSLVVCFSAESWARVCIVPGLLDALEERMALEEGAGVGLEVGRHDPGPLAHCPHYARVDRRFRRYHRACAAANVLSMACSGLHLYFLATRLRSALE